jgi:hypothetical protein
VSKHRVDLPSLYLKTEVSVEVEGRLVPAATALASVKGPMHVITAWNPGDARPTHEENEKANSELQSRLRAMGLHPVRALGADPDSDHAEESWAVVGLTDEQAWALGVEFGQVAVFRLTEGVQTVLACFEDWERSRAL